MKKYKSVSEVLRRGQIEVNGPVRIILVVVPILSIFLSLIIPEKYAVIGILSGLFLAFVLAWLWWSYKIVKWRIWAFENTKKSDWNKLKERAVIQKLIWNDGSIFERTEIRSKEDKRKIEKINSEIGQIEINKTEEDFSLDKIEDDPKVPTKIEYKYKRSETIMSAFLPIILITIGLYLISIDRIIIGILSVGMAIYHTDLNKIIDIWKKEIQFSIGDEGIDIKKFKQFGFVKWNNTQDISVDTESGILSLGVWEKDNFYEVTYNLNNYPIGDYDEFLRKINVYLKRNLKKENDSEQCI